MFFKKAYFPLILSFVLLLTVFPYNGNTNSSAKTKDKPKQEKNDATLWFDHSAKDWLEAFPVGNGRLGGMVYGGTDQGHIQLNEESLWAGSPVEDTPEQALEFLPDIQNLLLEGKNEEANELANDYLLADPPRFRSYQSFGDLYMDFGDLQDPENYRRELDMEKGIVRVTYTIDDVQYTREIFISAPDDVLVVRLTSSKPGAIDTHLRLDREQDAESVTISENEIALRGQIIDKVDPLRGPAGAHMRFESRLVALPEGGDISSEDGKINVEGANSLTLLLTAATDYDLETMDFNRSIDPGKVSQQILDKTQTKYYSHRNRLKAKNGHENPVEKQHNSGLGKGHANLDEKSYNRIRKNHVKDHSKMFNRVGLELGDSPNPDLPTNERLEAVKNGAEDPELVEQYFQYGRSLLFGSSRAPGRLPANLQGVWNKHMVAPWNSDYHTNINLQMNYWPAEVTNLSETTDPLIGFMEELTVPGSKTAEKMYGADGWTVHHNTNIF